MEKNTQQDLFLSFLKKPGLNKKNHQNLLFANCANKNEMRLLIFLDFSNMD